MSIQSIELLHTAHCLCFTVYAFDLLFCCQVTFCALVYFMWVFVLSQFPSHNNRKLITLVQKTGREFERAKKSLAIEQARGNKELADQETRG
jgi:hypothetical protein